jgi:hypothetical protein
MAEPSGDGQRLTVKTAFGEISATGGVTFIVIALLLLTGVALWEHYKRRQEFERLECTMELNLFMQTIPRGTQLSWNEIPSEYWRCLPAGITQKMKP